MNIREQAFGLVSIGVVSLSLVIGWAAARTWTATHTAFVLAGAILVLAIAAHGLAAAAGVALHDRRQASAPPTIHVSPGGVAGGDPMMALRMMDLQSRIQEREDRRGLALMPPQAPQIGAQDVGFFDSSSFAAPVSARGWEES